MRSFVRSKIGAILTSVFVCLVWVSPVTTKEFFRMSRDPIITKAPRTDGSTSGIVTCPSSCDLSGIEDCICSIKEDLRTTLTMLDGGGQVICPDELNCTDDVNAAIYSITSWLKTLYAYNRGWFCDDTCPT